MTKNQKLYLGLGVAAVLVYVYRDKIFGKKKGTTVIEPVVNPATSPIASNSGTGGVVGNKMSPEEKAKYLECENAYKDYLRARGMRKVVRKPQTDAQRIAERQKFMEDCYSGKRVGIKNR